MPASAARSVLITGASSGIGAAIAERLLAGGWQVIAAGRQQEPMAPLAERGAIVLPLDLADPASIEALAGAIGERVGPLDALVNNAGFGLVGPLETMPLEQARSIFEVNVFGLMGLTRLLLPPMRAQGRGRIVNISSIAGRWVTPGSGWYGASKFALEALSDALRLELGPFGLEVVVVEPGLIGTDFAARAEPSFQQGLACPVYGGMMARVRQSWQAVYQGASSPATVAATVETALNTARPRARYLCGHRSESVIAQRLLPTALWDRILRLQML